MENPLSQVLALRSQFMGRRHDRSVRIQQALLVWSQAKLDQSARVRSYLGLPAVLCLEAHKGVLGRLVPPAGRVARKVVLLHQSLLDGESALLVDSVLAVSG